MSTGRKCPAGIRTQTAIWCRPVLMMRRSRYCPVFERRRHLRYSVAPAPVRLRGPPPGPSSDEDPPNSSSGKINCARMSADWLCNGGRTIGTATNPDLARVI